MNFELIIAESLKSMLEGMGYAVRAIFTSGKKNLENFKSGFADIIMMDIHLADATNGVETAIGIRKMSSAPIIYITDNQDEYLRKKAIYETNTVQYITKPFTRLDVSIAIDLAIKAIKVQEPAIKPVNDSPYIVNESVFVKEGLGFKKILVKDIMFLKADGSYCRLFYKNRQKAGETDSNGSVLFSENLSFVEEKLLFAKNLVRVHRSYVINIDIVKRIHENRLWIEELEIPIGKTYKNDILERFRFIYVIACSFTAQRSRRRPSHGIRRFIKSQQFWRGCDVYHYAYLCFPAASTRFDTSNCNASTIQENAPLDTSFYILLIFSELMRLKKKLWQRSLHRHFCSR